MSSSFSKCKTKINSYQITNVKDNVISIYNHQLKAYADISAILGKGFEYAEMSNDTDLLEWLTMYNVLCKKCEQKIAYIIFGKHSPNIQIWVTTDK